MIVTQDFQPDWVSPPGDTIIDLMDEHGLSGEELSKRIGLSLIRVSNFLKEKSDSMSLWLVSLRSYSTYRQTSGSSAKSLIASKLDTSRK